MPPQGTKMSVLQETPETNLKDHSYVVAEEGTEWRIIWRNVLIIPLMLSAGLYGLYIALTQLMWRNWLFGIVYGTMSGLGITAGAHRLWAHRAYKAKWPLRVILIMFNSMAMQGPVYNWVRDHRIHHRYSETNADPHNSNRGFFFAHVGWLMLKKHPDIKANAHNIDMSDLRADPLVMYQKKYYVLLIIVFCVIIPTYIGTLLGDSLWVSFHSLVAFRFMLVLNSTWLVNSAAHIFGNKPYDKNINPAENRLVAFLAIGEGFHNYHHTYPWDYKTAELGGYSLNITKAFIDAMAWIGWAYDLKTVSPQVILDRKKKTGDGSHDVKDFGEKDVNVDIKKM